MSAASQSRRCRANRREYTSYKRGGVFISNAVGAQRFLESPPRTCRGGAVLHVNLAPSSQATAGGILYPDGLAETPFLRRIDTDAASTHGAGDGPPTWTSTTTWSVWHRLPLGAAWDSPDLDVRLTRALYAKLADDIAAWIDRERSNGADVAPTVVFNSRCGQNRAGMLGLWIVHRCHRTILRRGGGGGGGGGEEEEWSPHMSFNHLRLCVSWVAHKVKLKRALLSSTAPPPSPSAEPFGAGLVRICHGACTKRGAGRQWMQDLIAEEQETGAISTRSNAVARWWVAAGEGGVQMPTSDRGYWARVLPRGALCHRVQEGMWDGEALS